MTTRWITAEGILNAPGDYEETEITKTILYEGSEEPSILSSTLPSSFSVTYPSNGNILLKGVLPIVDEEKLYNITFRLRDSTNIFDRYFSIKELNKDVIWDPTQAMDLGTYKPNFDISIQLILLNTIGGEQFKKISGVLPKGISLSENGYLIGSTTEDYIDEEPYTFTVGIFRNDVKDTSIENKTFSITIQKSGTLNPPEWITDPGYIGAVSKNQSVNDLHVTAITDSSEGNVVYDLDTTKGSLPNGVSFIRGTGYLSGTCLTSVRQPWHMFITPIRIVGEEELRGEERDFYFISNPVAPEDEIIWTDDENLGTVISGHEIYGKFTAYCLSGKSVSYSVGAGCPEGFIISSSGNYYGNISAQEAKEYSFIVKATNGEDSKSRTFRLTVKKGMGTNSMNCFLRMAHTEDEMYDELTSEFNATTKYSTSDSKYNISLFPKIDVAQINCYDRELLSYITGVRSDTRTEPLYVCLKMNSSTTYTKITLNCGNITSVGKNEEVEITVPINSLVTWTAEKTGYETKTGSINVFSNMSAIIEMGN